MSLNERINGFDALRTIAMWLGVVLHASIVYKSIPEANWPDDATMASEPLQVLYRFIHVFRMPLFFLVAGFFARLVILRSGKQYFLRQRFKRIFIPFIIGILVLVPLSLLPFHFYFFYFQEQQSLRDAFANSLSRMIGWNGMAHLWFLYYLLIFYAFALLISGISSRIKFKNSYWKNNTPGLPGLLVFLIVLGGALAFFRETEPPVYTGIRPNLFYISYYGIFFFAGWVMQINKQTIREIAKFPILFMVAGIAGFIALESGNLGNSIVLRALLGSVQTIGLVLGFTGLFIRFFNAESRLWRYCSDSAYWVYLCHLAVVALMQVILLNSAVPPLLRFPVVLITAIVISLLSYQYLVRYTIIGEYLHGPRTRKPGRTRQHDSNKINIEKRQAPTGV